MEWQLILLLVVGGLISLMAIGMPVAVAFLMINAVGAFLLWGGGDGLRLLVDSMLDSVTSFILVPLPLFALMGAILFHSGIAPRMIDALDKWLGRLPGRLGLEAVGGAAILSALTGSDEGTVAILGSVLVPEMQKRGYKKPMSLGPILGAGGLAVMIPPSGLAVFLAALAQVSIGRVLLGIIFPGILMGVLYATYIIIRARIQPHLAPPYDVTHISLSEKLTATVRHILPVGFIIFMVTGIILFGIATPTEAAATGAIASCILAASYRQLNWRIVKSATFSAISLTGMLFIILVGSQAFGQILAYTGASRGIVEVVTNLPLNPIFIMIAMQLIVLLMGTFLSITAVMMVTIPLFMPIIYTLGFDPIWFSVIYMLNAEMASVTPPFGFSLFVMKGVAPAGTTMGDVYRAGLPFLGCDTIAMALIIAFPSIALWLPGLMR